MRCAALYSAPRGRGVQPAKCRHSGSFGSRRLTTSLMAQVCSPRAYSQNALVPFTVPEYRGMNFSLPQGGGERVWGRPHWFHEDSRLAKPRTALACAVLLAGGTTAAAICWVAD